MNLFRKLGIAAVGLVVGFGTLQGQAHAHTTYNMIRNGEFEETKHSHPHHNHSEDHNHSGTHGDSQSYQFQASDWVVSDTYTQNSFLKQQGYSIVDETGSDGELTGNFFASDSWEQWGNVSQTFTLEENINTNALFLFDYATYSGNESYMHVFVDGSESGELLHDEFLVRDTFWTEYDFDVEVVPGEQITVSYYSVGQNAIDNVSFLVTENTKKLSRKAPEPTSILGLIAISGLAASFLKRKRKSTNI